MSRSRLSPSLARKNSFVDESIDPLQERLRGAKEETRGGASRRNQRMRRGQRRRSGQRMW